MDRNNDGDLSWDEFQASRQDFEQIDADGDELIDSREAYEAEAEYERRKKAAADGNPAAASTRAASTRAAVNRTAAGNGASEKSKPSK